MFCCACNGSCNHTGPHSYCPAHGGGFYGGGIITPVPPTDYDWQPRGEAVTVWQLPFYRSGYLAGWRDAMAEAKGGDWSQETPAWWPDPPGEPAQLTDLPKAES